MKRFREIWLCDFEFNAPPGENPEVLCFVGREYRTGQELRFWRDELAQMSEPPFSVGRDACCIAYYASAEMSCHCALGWPMPANLIDLFAEFRNTTNGLDIPCGNGLLGALTYYGLNGIASLQKRQMRDLALRGGPYSADERAALLNYCASDVSALERLLKAMGPSLDVDRALLRGRYMKAAARIEWAGIPIDTEQLEKFQISWGGIQEKLIGEIDSQFGVFEGRTFKRDRFKAWLAQNGIPWPTLPSGEIDLSDDTFKEMAGAWPILAPLRELRQALSTMRLSSLMVGRDGRNRCLLSAFRASTGRNQPSNSKFIFGPSTWLRGLIKAPQGFGLAYIDWSQQEFGIAGALSDDPLMMNAYCSGDPYLAFAKQAGAVPAGATKATHSNERDQFKACVLAVQYGMGAESLAVRIGQPPIVARQLLDLHRRTYRRFWQWSNGCLDHAMLHGKLWTTFGWTIHVNGNANPRSLRNFPVQANGAEMLRLACCLTTEAGIRVCAPVHDALLIEAPLDELDATVQRTQDLMKEASAIVLDGFELRSSAEVVLYPGRYMDQRGRKMWDAVQKILVQNGGMVKTNRG